MGFLIFKKAIHIHIRAERIKNECCYVIYRGKRERERNSRSSSINNQYNGCVCDKESTMNDDKENNKCTVNFV